MSFQQGLSGLNAAGKSLEVIGNNIANSNSVGFKASGAQFADVFANSLTGSGGGSIGIGTKLAAVMQEFTQGNITTTNNPLDVAINGGGFFRLSDSGAISYTRNGQFLLDKDGYLITSQGQRVTGYGADGSGNIVSSAPVDVQVSLADIAPRTTSSINAVFNLDARSPEPLTPVFDPSDPTSYTNSTSTTVFDSLGNPHVMSLFFVKTGAANGWNLYSTLDGTGVGNVDLGAGAGLPVAIDFDTSGMLTTAMPLPVTDDLDAVATDLGLVNGAGSPLAMTFDMRGSTQFGSLFGINSMSQDGYAAGRLAGLGIGVDGVVSGRYTNGQTRALAQLVLANFNNPQGLKPIGGNQWTETADSGPALVGAPGSGTLGILQPAAVEDSNVDLTAELVNMITMQRAYQANAQTIKTQDALMQTIVNLR